MPETPRDVETDAKMTLEEAIEFMRWWRTEPVSLDYEQNKRMVARDLQALDRILAELQLERKRKEHERREAVAARAELAQVKDERDDLIQACIREGSLPKGTWPVSRAIEMGAALEGTDQ